MKYCTQFHKNFAYLDKIDELIIDYNKNNINIIDFVQTERPQEQRIILDIYKMKEKLDFRILEAAVKVHKNLAVKLGIHQLDIANELSVANISFFFEELANNWDTLISFINYGVSDVYIANEMGFDIKEISKICKRNNVNIRVFPNVAQNGSKLTRYNEDSFKSFYIRPEDTCLYECYVDVFEFFGTLDRHSVLYDIYTSQKWSGDLKDLIIGLNTSINNRSIVPAFGDKRLDCQKKCNKGNCVLCDKIFTFNKELVKNNIVFKKNEVTKDEQHQEDS